MLLVDRVAQGARVTVMRNKEGGEHAVPGPGSFEEELRRCPLRFVLDRTASAQCTALFRSAEQVPRPDDELTRFPADRFWLETFADEEDSWHAGERLGFLADLEPDGRSGSVTCFGQRPDGSAEYLGCSVVFGFDGVMPAPRGLRFRLHAVDVPQIAGSLECAMLEIAPTHRKVYTSSPSTLDGMLRLMAGSAWAALPLLLSFSAMLNSRSVITAESSDLGRLNASRRKRGRPELLDHVKIGLDLAFRPLRDGVATSDAAARRAPRLHFVRGHAVRRAGKSFWRTSHLRGEGDVPLKRSVAVTSSGASDRRAAALIAAHREGRPSL